MHGILAAIALSSATVAPAQPPIDLLVFTRTVGFRHPSIVDGLIAIDELAVVRSWTVTATEDPTAFTAANLARFDAVVFLLTSGDVLDPSQQTAFEDYLRGGGGYAGIHSACDTEYDWPWYGDLVGAWFNGHPAPQDATLLVEDPSHPSTATLPAVWPRFDEWYNFDRPPRPGVHVLLTIDESTYVGGTHGSDHPIAWCHDYDGGRSWYSALGHTNESYGDPAFRDHLAGGIEYAAGAAPGNCDLTPREPSPSLAAIPLKVVKGVGASLEVVVEDIPFATGYVVYDQSLDTWYGTPLRTCHATWSDLGDAVRLDHDIATGDRWLVVAAANGSGESSCGQAGGGGELNELPGWPATAPCP